MNQFEDASNHQAPGNALPPGRPDAAWRQIFRRALHQSTWKRTPHLRTEPSDAVKTPSRSPVSRTGLIALAVLLVLFAIPVVLVAKFVSRHSHPYKQGQSIVASSKHLLGMNQGSSGKPKPSPYKYTLATPITHPSNPIVITPPRLPNSSAAVAPQAPTQAPSVTPILPPTANSLPSPPPSAASARTPFTPVVYSAHHDKHFGGCSGQLTLNSAGLNFRCPENPGDSIQVALNEIGAVDENGIQTLSGKKYHFTINGLSKPAAQQIFSSWLHQVR